MNNLKQIISSLFVYSNDQNPNSNFQTMDNVYMSNDVSEPQLNLPQLNMDEYYYRRNQNRSQDFILKNILYVKEKEAELKKKKFSYNQSLDNINPHYHNRMYDSIPCKVYDRVYIYLQL